MNHNRSRIRIFHSLNFIGSGILFCMALLFSSSFSGAEDVPYESMPDWVSSDQEVSTGAALADLDLDGWPDFVVANGNDISRQHLVVYYNQGGGVFPALPDWESDDVDYHGHLAVGDVNNDGYPDVAVSVYLGPGGFEDPGRVKLYVNDGTGTLGALPAWSTASDVYTFRCAWGDVDLDGDLDLAVACGESYTNNPQANRVYQNINGTLQSTPFWTSSEVDSSYDAAWSDVDLDGDLDLAFCNSGEPNRVYYNHNGSLSTMAGWSSTDSSRDANTLAWGDVNGDRYPELAVADNNQLGGSGRFKVYMNNGAGQLGTTPFWSSSESGYGSSVVFSDVDDDGDLDLASGQWWGPVRIYLNTAGSFPASASWQSATGSVIERIYFADVDRDDIVTQSETFNGSQKLFTLSRKPVEEVVDVAVDGVSLPLDAYCFDLENGWVSLGDDPAGADVTVSYKYSFDQDIAISNWDSSKGNYMFLNTGAHSSGEVILIGPGPGLENRSEVRGFQPFGVTHQFSFQAYGTDKFGVNVAAGNVDGNSGMEIITGPGPGEVFGPHVRTFKPGGIPVAGATFLSYGTKKWGVRVTAGDLDGDGRDEYVTGPGPGEVFGPHVRAFRFSGGAVTPVSGVSFFAYGTKRWGANVSCGDLDGDGYDEIITGAGPGAVFGPHVRGFNVDGGTAAPVPGVSFFAYGTKQWGVNVSCGDLDGDGYGEILAGAGPGAVFGPHVRGFNVDGASAVPMSGVSFFAYGTRKWGVQIGRGDVDTDGFDEMLTAPGPNAQFGAHIRGWNYDGVIVTAMDDINFFAFPTGDVRYGANVSFMTY